MKSPDFSEEEIKLLTKQVFDTFEEQFQKREKLIKEELEMEKRLIQFFKYEIGLPVKTISCEKKKSCNLEEAKTDFNDYIDYLNYMEKK